MESRSRKRSFPPKRSIGGTENSGAPAESGVPKLDPVMRIRQRQTRATRPIDFGAGVLRIMILSDLVLMEFLSEE